MHVTCFPFFNLLCLSLPPYKYFFISKKYAGVHVGKTLHNIGFVYISHYLITELCMITSTDTRRTLTYQGEHSGQ